MPYEKNYRTVVPVEHGADMEQARWLVRESFENRATSDCLELHDYAERELAVEDVPPKAAEQLGRPLTDFTWWEFTGFGRLNQELFDWLAAEDAWRNEQTRAWLDAETAARTNEVAVATRV